MMTAKELARAAALVRKVASATKCTCGAPAHAAEDWFGRGELMSRFDDDSRVVEHIKLWSPALALTVAAWLEAEASVRAITGRSGVPWISPLTSWPDEVAGAILRGTEAPPTPGSERVGVQLETMDGVLDLADVWWQQVEDDGFITGLTAAVAPEGLLVTSEHAGRALADNEDHYYELVDSGVTWRPRKDELAVAEMRDQRERRLCDPSVPGGAA